MADEQKSLLSPEHWDAIIRYAIGGGLVGAGIGGASNLIQYLKRLNKDSREEDDDTLYIYRDSPQEKTAGAWEDPIGSAGEAAGKFMSWLASKGYNAAKSIGDGLVSGAEGALDDTAKLFADPTAAGLAVTGATVSGLGGYALLKKLYAQYEKEKAQDELDKAQMAFLDAQGYKKASADGEPVEFTGADITGGLLVALPLLTALGAGVATHKYLDMTYPTKKKLPKAPRRIEVVDKPDSDAAEYDEPMPGYDKEANAREFALYMVDAIGADDSDVRNLISATANAGTTEFKKAAAAMGFFDALDMVKGASSQPTDPKRRAVAISYLAKSARLSAPLAVVAAGELAEAYPTLFKTAAALSEAQRDSLFNMAADLGAAIRAENAFACGLVTEDMAKSAANNSSAGVEDALEKYLNNANVKPATEGDYDESSNLSGDESGKPNDTSASRPDSLKQVVMTGKTGRTHIDQNRLDPIDEFLSPTEKGKDATSRIA